MNRRLFNIAVLKEQQKRCSDCQCELYAIQDRKHGYGSKLGKAQDPMFYFKDKGKPMLLSGIGVDNIGSKQFINRNRLVPNKRNFYLRGLNKHFLQTPESQRIILECPACRYYCSVYERTSVL